MAELTVTAEPIELTSDDGITLQVGGTVTITSEGGGGTFDGVHNDLDGRDTADAHPASAVGLTQTTPADWTTDPATVQDALDELAGREGGGGVALPDSRVLVQLPAAANFAFGNTITHFTEELPALRAGDLVRLTACLSWKNASGSPRSFGVTLRLGSTTVASTTAVSYATGFTRTVHLEAVIHVLSTTSQVGSVATVSSSSSATGAGGVATENVASAGVQLALDTNTHSSTEARLDGATITIERIPA